MSRCLNETRQVTYAKNGCKTTQFIRCLHRSDDPRNWCSICRGSVPVDYFREPRS